MAKGFWRGQAAQENIHGRWLGNYLSGLYGEGGAWSGALENITGGLVESQMPQFENIMGKYMGQAAGLGQAVPGQGLSGKATEGMMQTGADWMTGNVTIPALQAYTMPWQGAFQSTGQISPAYMGTKAAPTASEQLQQPMGGCCFIFIEADNGKLNRIARKWRDENGTPKAKSGYRRLANWLVPKMKESKAIKNLVKFFMVKPMIQAGRFAYRENNWGHIFVPLAIAWMMLFETLGMRNDYVYSPGA